MAELSNERTSYSVQRFMNQVAGVACGVRSVCTVCATAPCEGMHGFHNLTAPISNSPSNVLYHTTYCISRQHQA